MAGIDWEKGQITPPKQTSAQEGATDWEKGVIQKPAGFLRKAGDLGLSLLKGAVAIPEAAVGLADIPTGGRVGKFLENEGGAIGFRPKQAKEVISGWQSDDLRSKSQAFQNADGVIDKAATAISNPSLVANAVAESLPLMGAGGVLARGLMAVAPGVGAVGAGAIGEGVMGAGSAAEQMRQETADGTLTAKQSALAGLSGAATAGFGALGGKVAQKLGIGDVDTMIAKGSINAGSVPGKGFIRRGAEGALSEGLLEELPQSLSEQAIQNIGLDKPIAEGMADAAVMGTLAGAAMGGGAGVLSGFGQEPQQAAPGQPPAPAGTQPAAPTDRGFNPQALQAEQNARLDALAAEEAGTPSVAQTTPPDGAAALAAQRAQAEQARLAQLEASRSEPSPDDEIFQSTGADVASVRPSQAMGLDPAAGPMSAAAALAVDGGATARVQAEQALNAAAEAAPKTKSLDEATPDERAAYEAATTDPTKTKQGVADRRKAAIEGLLERAALQSEGQTLAQDDTIDPPFELGGQKNGQPDAAGGKPGNTGADTGLADAGRATPDAARVPGAASADTAGQPQRFAALSGLEPMAKATPGQKVKSLKEFMAKKKAEREAPNVQDQTPGTAGAQTQAAADQAPQAVGGQPAGAAARVPAAGDSGVEAAGVAEKAAAPIVEHTTSKGKVLRGVVRNDMTLDQAKEYDPYAFKKDGGVFIRKQHLDNLPATTEPTNGTQAPQAQQAETQGPQAPAAAAAVTDDLGAQWSRMTTVERQALATRAGVKGVAAKNLATRVWDAMDPIQRDRLRKGFEPLKAGGAAEQVVQAANEAATSPDNDLPEPTQAQKEAGNYKKGHVQFDGLDLTVENPAGSTRSGVDPNGKPWEVTMTAHYGYHKRTMGADGDQVDVYLADNPVTGSPVFVFDQFNADGSFDEHKAVAGVATEAEAKAIYDAHFSDGSGPKRRRTIKSMTPSEFKAWAMSDAAKQPLAPAFSDGFVEPAQPTEAPAQPKTVKQGITNARAKKAAEAEAQRAEYFAPGNILKGYGGHDRVLEYVPVDERGTWSVRVQRVVKQGEQWVDAPNERPRWHSTQPEAKELAAGPVVKGVEAPKQVTLTVENALTEIEKAKANGRDAVYRELSIIRGLSSSVFNGVANRLTGSYTNDGQEWSQESLTNFLMPSVANDRDTFTLDRLNPETDRMELVTFRRGETVKIAAGQRPYPTGVITGISHAERTFKVDGRDHGLSFGYAYKADFDEMAGPRKEVDDELDKLEQRLNDGNAIQSEGFIRSAKETVERNNLGDYAKDRIAQLARRAAEVSNSVLDKMRAATAEKERADAQKRAEEQSNADTPRPPIEMTMDEWKAVPKDFKGIIDGQRTVMRDGGIRAVTIIQSKSVDSKTPTVDRSMAVMDAVRAGTGSLDDYKASFAALEANEEAVKAELSTKTKDELLKAGGPYFYMRFKNETKPEIIRVFYKDLLNEYALGKSYGSSGWVMSSGGFAAHEERQHEALKVLVESQTEEDLKAYAAEVAARRAEVKATREAKQAAMQNPQTLGDFRAVMREHITEGKTRKEAFLMLTPEQRIRYDELEAETTMEEREARKRERKTEIRAASQSTSGEIVATKHTRDGYDLFVVQLAERLSAEDYKTVLASAKRLGGWYSAFRGKGAIPGFQFKDRANAEAFLRLAGGDTADAQAQAEQRRDAFEDDRSETAVERLRAMADKLEDQAGDIENADRKTNTARRARFAASALNGAAEMKAKAKTMRNVAQAIEDGRAKFLDGVRTKTQVDMLTSMVATAKNNELRAKYESYADQEKHKGERPTAETADFAEFPAFTAYRSDLASLARQMLEVEGTKKLGQQLMKVADDVSDAYLDFAREPANLIRLSAFSVRRGDEVGSAIFSSKELAEKAIKRSGLTGKAIVLAEKRGVNRVIMSPGEAMGQGIWTGDGDKRITLTADAGNALVEAIGRRGNKSNGLVVPWQFQTAHDRLKALARMGIETPAEFRSALREFISLQELAASNKVREMELAMVGKKSDGLDFFPTPAEVADQMVEAADLTPEMAVLEPSAGMAHIADRITQSGVTPDVVEMAEDRRGLLEAKGYELVGRDFLELSEKRYDRIIMNPPFSNRRDAEHVRHAYTLLKPGGRIVAIMGEGVFFGQDRKAQEFRDWLESVGGTSEKLPEGSFMDPSLPVNTGVNARMVVIDKPAGNADSNGDAVFSQGLLAPTAMGPKPTVQAVQALVGKVQTVSKDVLPVSVVGNPSEVPGLQVPAGTQPTGVLTGGRIYLFADNFGTFGEAYATLFHEIFHLGLQRVIPAEDYAALLKKFANGAQVQNFMRQWKSSPEGRQRANTMPSAAYEALATEEALAMVAEELSESGIGTNRMPGLVKKMLSWLADVADRLGFPGAFGNWVRGLTQTQAERFVSDMTRAVLGGARNLAKTQAKYGTMAKEMTQQTRLRSDAQEAELAELFNALQAPRGVKLAQAQRQVSAHPMAEQIRNIEANFMDMLAHLDDAKLVQINC